MADYTDLKSTIDINVNTNGERAITGGTLNTTLKTIVDTVNSTKQDPGTGGGGGFVTCSTTGSSAAKLINDATTIPNFTLDKGVRLLVKFEHANTVANPTLNINSTGATSMKYNGANASASNTWADNEVVDLYYDGSYYILMPCLDVDDEPTAGSDNLVKSGGVAEELALGAVYDVSAKNPTAGPNNDGKWESLSALLSDANLSTLIPTAVRKGGMSIKFVQSSDNKYVQYMLNAQNWSLNIGDWEKMNLEDKVSQLEHALLSTELRNDLLYDIGSTLNKIYSKEFTLNFSETNKIISATGLSIINQIGGGYDPNYYPVIQGLVLTHNLKGFNSSCCIVFYDANKNIISTTQYDASTLHHTTIPEGVYYVRFSMENMSFNPYVRVDMDLSSFPFVNENNYQEFKDATERYLKETEGYLPRILDLSNVEQGLFNLSSGSIAYTTGDYPNNRYCPTYFSVKANQKLIVLAYLSGNYASVAYYDINKNYLSGVTLSYATPIEITVPNNPNIAYVRFCTERYNTYGLSAEIESYKTIPDVENLENRVSPLEESVSNTEKFLPFDCDTSNVEQGLLKKSDGQPAYTTGDYPNYRYCPTYFPVKANQKYKTNATGSGTVAAIVFYNSSKVAIGYQETYSNVNVIKTFTAPNDQNIAYARFCTEKYGSFGLYAQIENIETTPEIKELQDKVESLENKTETENLENYFDINQDDWIVNETAKSYSPNSTRITHKYTGSLNPQKRFVALGFDDFRASDFSLIIPLLNKYGAKADFNRVHSSDTVTLTDIKRVKNVVNGLHELGDHTWMHYPFPYFDPLFNGQNPDNPEGNQTAFPSNSQLRDDVGNGKNVFGRNLTTNINTDLGTAVSQLDTTWGSLTDEQCQFFRTYFSVMYDTASNICPLLDRLSNKYLGTSGNSRNSWDNDLGQYTGGIFTGCKTSENHEVWERILQVTNMFLKDVFNLNYDLITWSYPGGRTSKCWFLYDGRYYFDSNHTQLYGNLAKFTSSLYQNQDGTYKERSWTDVLREFKYKTTHDTRATSELYCSRYQFIMNAKSSRIDALPQSTNRSINYERLANELNSGDLSGTEPLEVQMYDRSTQAYPISTFKTAIENWRLMTANGIIWGEVIDSYDTYSERMILEGLMKYCKSADIELITKAEAYDICFGHQLKDGNLIYNPTFRNTAKEFLPTALTVPSNPDGFDGNCSVSIIDNIPILITSGWTRYCHFGIPIGKIKFSVDVKGTGTIGIYEIKNDSIRSNVQAGDVAGLNSLASISFTDDTQFVSKNAEFTIVDYPVEAYEQVFEGYGNKTVGVMIRFSSGLQVKNMDMRLI